MRLALEGSDHWLGVLVDVDADDLAAEEVDEVRAVNLN